MTIQAAEAAVATRPDHPDWCAADIPAHISVEQVVVATSGPERTEVYVSIEQAQGEPAAVRIQGGGDTPMTPTQAVQLGTYLIAQAAVAAQSTWSVTR